MIALLKVYKTLYQNDEREILYVMIVKSKLSDHFLKNVLLPYVKSKAPSASFFGGLCFKFSEGKKEIDINCLFF